MKKVFLRQSFLEILFFVILFSLLNARLVRSDNSDPFELNQEGIEAAEKGDFEKAVTKLEQAYHSKNEAQIAKNLSKILSDWAIKLYNQNQSDQALLKLEDSVKYDSSNGPAWYFMGDIHYLKRSNFESALKAWKKALETAPNQIRPAIIERISRAETDMKLERNFNAKESAHFVVRYPESVSQSFVESVISILESEYQKLSSELNVSPSRLNVIVYPKQSFDRLSSRFDWALGFYDGRIRIRENELGSGLETTILSHELAHAFLQNGFGANVSTWIHEGYAQTREPPRNFSEDEKEVLEGVKNRTKWIPLEWIDKRFVQPVDSDDVTRAYLQSSIAVSYLIQKFGMDQFRQFLKVISQGKSISEAFDRTFRSLKWSAFSNGSFVESI